LIVLLVLFGLLLAAGNVFNAVALLGQGSTVRTSPLTLLCLLLLVLAQCCRRAPYGYFSVLVGSGIGSKFARLAVPTSQLLVFLLIGAGERLLAMGYLTLPYTAALTTSSLAGLFLLLIVVVARKVNNLERELRDMSLTDELTGLHNRRSFYLLGEQAVRDARREAGSLTVLFFDADGLMKVNDSLGHDIGSEFLCDVALLLSTTFRSNDVVGRLGGDEFAVIAHGSEAELLPALRRLEKAIEGANSAGKPYRVSVSVGVATTEPPSKDSFAELVERADAAMYRDKRKRRVAREALMTPQPAVVQIDSSRG
jgi:diguanylate cyclase (GGDEF)-like protein